MFVPTANVIYLILKKLVDYRTCTLGKSSKRSPSTLIILAKVSKLLK